MGLGGSVLEYDVGGDNAWFGYLARAGVQVGGVAAVTMTGQLWPKLAYDERGRSVLVELSYSPLGRRRVAPYMSFGVGHFSATLPGAADPVESGVAKALGIGVQVWPLSAWGLDMGAFLRIDGGNGDDELRLSLLYGPVDPRWRQRARLENPVSLQVVWLVPISGPWRFVAPGYLISLGQTISGHHSASLGMALVHWQIPFGSSGAYEYDTRAALFAPAWRWVENPTAPRRAYVQAGPLLSGMVEGPDDGFRGGVHAGVGYDLGLRQIGVSGGATLLWLSRADSRGDQRGVLLQAGLTF